MNFPPPRYSNSVPNRVEKRFFLKIFFIIFCCFAFSAKADVLEEEIYTIFDIESIVSADSLKMEIKFPRGVFTSDLKLIRDLVYKGNIAGQDVLLRLRYSKKFMEWEEPYDIPDNISDCQIEITNSLQVGKLLKPTFTYGSPKQEAQNFASVETNAKSEKKEQLRNDMNEFSQRNDNKIVFNSADISETSYKEPQKMQKPQKEKVEDCYKLLFIGARVGVSLGSDYDYYSWNYNDYYVWNLSDDDNLWLSETDDVLSKANSFDVAPFVNVQLAENFAIQTEAIFTSYNYLFYEDKGVTHTKYTLSKSMIIIPVLLNVTIGQKRVVKIFAGPHFNIVPEIWMWKWKRTDSEVYDVTYKMSSQTFKENYGEFYNAPVGFTWGISAGYRVFLDARWSFDFGGGTNFPVVTSIDSEMEYTRRFRFSLSVGFEIGTINRKW